MKKTKTSYKMYTAWEFDREIRDLDEESRKGWQLTKGGCFHSKYHFDDGVCYRYALDYNQEISDPVRYRETFAEQGWEFVNSTFNGWHYFRKVFDPALPEEEYQIYTDAASRREMAGRWRKLAYGLGGAELLVGLVNLFICFSHPAIHSVCLALACLLMGALLVAGAKRIGSPAKRRSLISAKMLIPILALLVLTLVFACFRDAGFSTQTQYIVPEGDEPWLISFDVKLPDIYTLNLAVDAPASLSARMVRLDGEGNPAGDDLFSARGQIVKESAPLFLVPGSYRIAFQYDSGAEPGLEGQVECELR